MKYCTFDNEIVAMTTYNVYLKIVVRRAAVTLGTSKQSFILSLVYCLLCVYAEIHGQAFYLGARGAQIRNLGNPVLKFL